MLESILTWIQDNIVLTILSSLAIIVWTFYIIVRIRFHKRLKNPEYVVIDPKDFKSSAELNAYIEMVRRQGKIPIPPEWQEVRDRLSGDYSEPKNTLDIIPVYTIDLDFTDIAKWSEFIYYIGRAYNRANTIAPPDIQYALSHRKWPNGQEANYESIMNRVSQDLT